jgi:hypothetical protein
MFMNSNTGCLRGLTDDEKVAKKSNQPIGNKEYITQSFLANISHLNSTDLLGSVNGNSTYLRRYGRLKKPL